MIRCGGIVVCGGRGTRMGIPKVRLPFGDEPMLARIVRRLSVVTHPVVVVAAVDEQLPPLPAGVAVAHDRSPGCGPLEGIAVGLRYLQDEVEAAYVTSCDVPGITPEFVRYMIDRLGTDDVAVPKEGEFYHPLAAVYRTSVLTDVEQLLAAGQRRPYFLLGRVAVREVTTDELRTVDPELRTLHNLNQPDDYRQALEREGLPIPAGWDAAFSAENPPRPTP